MSLWRRPDAAQRAAFEDFVQRCGPALAGLARGLTSSPADAEDLLQESLAKVLERWDLVAAADDPYLYARRVVVNASTSTWRRRHREWHPRSAEHVAADRGEEHVLWRTAVSDVSELDERMATVELLRGLPPRQRAVIVLRYLEDLPDAQVAELLASALSRCAAPPCGRCAACGSSPPSRNPSDPRRTASDGRKLVVTASAASADQAHENVLPMIVGVESLISSMSAGDVAVAVVEGFLDGLIAVHDAATH